TLQQQQQPWSGLSRYTNTDTRPISIQEYAKVSDVLDCESLQFLYTVDIPGAAPKRTHFNETPSTTTTPNTPKKSHKTSQQIGNGVNRPPPRCTAHILVKNSTISYGPWTNRQRSILQSFFFPASFRDAIVTEEIKPGGKRVPVELEVVVGFLGKCVWRVPCRESSKDWMYFDEGIGVVGVPGGGRTAWSLRPFGRLDVQFSGGDVGLGGREIGVEDLRDLKEGVERLSRVVVKVPFVVKKEEGVDVEVNVALRDVEVTSTVHENSMVKFESVNVDITSTFPEKYHAHRPSKIHATCLNTSSLHPLRDHIELLIDMFKDFGSSDGSSDTTLDAKYFVSSEIDVVVEVEGDVEVSVCVNQENVINLANDLNENSFIIVKTPKLTTHLHISFTSPLPTSQLASFSIKIDTPTLLFSFPKSHTLGAFCDEGAKEIGKSTSAVDVVGKLVLTRDVGEVDSCVLDIYGSQVNCTMFGYLIRQFLYLKDNYFGEFNTFTTTDEYRKRVLNFGVGKSVKKLKDKASESQMEFVLRLIVTESNILVPENLYSVDNCLMLQVRRGELELRVTPSFIDLQVNLSPVYVKNNDGVFFDSIPTGSDIILLEGLSIHGHRITGPAPFYPILASEWKFHIDSISGTEISPRFIQTLESSTAAVVFNFLDSDNSLTTESTASKTSATNTNTGNANNATINATTAKNKEEEEVEAVAVFLNIGRVNFNVKFTEFLVGKVDIDTVKFRYFSGINTKWTGRVYAFVEGVGIKCFLNSQSDSVMKKFDSDDEEVDFDDVNGVGDSESKWCKVLDIQTPQIEFGSFFVQENAREKYSRQIKFIQKNDGLKRVRHLYDSGGVGVEYSIFMGVEELLVKNFGSVGRSGFGVKVSELEKVKRRLNLKYESRGGSDGRNAGVSTRSTKSSVKESRGGKRFSKNVEFAYKKYLHRFKFEEFEGERMKRSIGVFPYYYYDGMYSGSRREFGNRGGGEKKGGGRVEEQESLFVSFEEEMDEFKNEEGSKTVLTLEVGDAVDVFATPVFFKGVMEWLDIMEDDIQNITASTILDQIQLKYMNTLTQPRSQSKSTQTSLIFQLPGMNLVILEDMTLPKTETFLNDEATPNSPTSPIVTAPPTDDLVCIFKIKISEIDLRTMIDTKSHISTQPVSTQPTTHYNRKHSHQKTSSQVSSSGRSGGPITTTTDFEFELNVDGFLASLQFVGSNIHLISNGVSFKPDYIDTANFYTPEINRYPTVLVLETGKLDVNVSTHKSSSDAIFEPLKISLQTQTVSVTSTNQTIEILFGTVFTWYKTIFLDLLQQKITGYQHRLQRHYQTMVSKIVQFAQNKNITGDPAFLSEPSALWLLGKRDYQDDRGWKLVSHLRFCLMMLKDVVGLKSPTLMRAGMRNAEDMYSQVTENLSSWRSWEPGSVEDVKWLKELYGVKDVISGSDHAMLKLLSDLKVAVKIEELSVIVVEETGDDNILRLQNIDTELNSIFKPRVKKTGMRTVSISDGVVRDGHVEFGGKLVVGRIEMTFDPNLLSFIRHAVRVYRWFLQTPKDARSMDVTATSGATVRFKESALDFDAKFSILVGKFHIRALAHTIDLVSAVDNISLQLEHKTTGFRNVVGLDALSKGRFSVKGIKVQLSERIIGRHTDLLESFAFEVNDTCCDVSVIPEEPFNKLSVQFSVKQTVLKLQRSLLKLNAFLEKWSDEQLPTYDFLIGKVVSEWDSIHQEKKPHVVTKPKVKRSAVTDIDLLKNVELRIESESFLIESELISSLRLNYSAENFGVVLTVAQSVGFESDGDGLNIDYNVKLSHHEVRFFTKISSAATSSTSTTGGWGQQSATFLLPSITSEGVVKIPGLSSTEADKHITVNSTIELSSIAVSLTVNMIDQLLTTQSVLGSEFNDAVETLMFFARKPKRRSSLVTPTTPSAASSSTVFYALKISIHGLKIDAVSPFSTILLTSGVLNGEVRNYGSGMISLPPPLPIPSTPIAKAKNDHPLMWNIAATDFKLSVYPSIDKELITAETIPVLFILFDLALKNHQMVITPIPVTSTPHSSSSRRRNTLSSVSTSNSEAPSFDLSGKTYFLQFNRFQAVMRPNSLSRLVDTWIFYTRELEQRKEVKAQDLANLQENTRRLFQSFDMPIPQYTIPKISFFEEVKFDVTINNISVVVPLSDKFDKKYANDAFVVSVRSVRFSRQRDLNSSGQIRDLALMFDSNFENSGILSSESRISGEHESGKPNSRNRFLLRKVQVELLESERLLDERKFRVHAAVKGFELEVDTQIVEYLLRLLDVYERGRESVGSLIPASASESSHAEELPTAIPTLPTSAILIGIEGSMELERGTCTVHPDSQAKSTDTFQSLIFPNITIQFGGDAVFGEEKESQFLKRSGLHIEMLIHPSENVVNPSILTFVDEVINNLTILRQSKVTQLKIAASAREQQQQEMMMNNIIKVGSQNSLTFKLRMSKTKVELNTQPLFKVILLANINVAEFLFTWTPRPNTGNAKNILSCAGFVDGTFGSLRHAFSPEDCLLADIQKVTASVTMVEYYDRNRTYSIEFGVPNCIISANMRHLQDLFMFLKVWVPNFADLSTNPSGVLEESTTVAAKSPTAQTKTGSVVNGNPLNDLAKFSASLPNIVLNVDMGQAIGKANVVVTGLKVDGSIGWKNLQLENRDLEFVLGSVKVGCEGRLGGVAILEELKIVIQARNALSQRLLESDATSRSEILGTKAEIKVTKITSEIYYQHERILIVELANIAGVLNDQWTFEDKTVVDLLTINQNVKVEGVNVVISRHTIPTFYEIYNRLATLIEEKRSLVMDATMKRDEIAVTKSKSVNASTNTKTNLLEVSLGRPLFLKNINVPLIGKLELSLGKTFVTLARQSFRDPEYAQFLTNGCFVEFSHSPKIEELFEESTSIKLMSFVIRKATTRTISKAEEQQWTSGKWIETLNSASSKTVFEVPESTMTLKTSTFLALSQVEYSLVSNFSGQIDIALNIGLYKYLQDLIQAYAEFASADVGSTVTLPGGSVEAKKEVPIKEISPKGFAALLKHSKKTEEVAPTTERRPSTPTPTPKPGEQSELNNAETTVGAAANTSVAFVRNGDMKFDPLLKVTGDATPWEWIEWIAVHKERVPKLLYIFVTRNTAFVFEIVNGTLYSRLIDYELGAKESKEQSVNEKGEWD
ncbi:hypothetical protein HK098_003270, partial [Nowakowskiella sp. JEL0407]